LALLKRMFLALYRMLLQQDYFYEALGYECVDAGTVLGTLGADVGGVLIIKLRKDNLWPVEARINDYSEDDLFDMVEFLYDHVSKPINGNYHSWNDCGMHWTTFDRETGQAEFRRDFNGFANDYEDGFELSPEGDILLLAEPGFETLVDTPLPTADAANVRTRVERATKKFRYHRSTDADRRDALRELADVLEYLRPEMRRVLAKKDESDLFNIINNFGIRHHSPDQKTDYNKPIWYSWMFYFYLATIHATVRLIEKALGTGPV